MHASVTQLHLTLLRPFGLYPTRLVCPWNFSSKNTGVGWHFPPPGDLPNPGIESLSPESPALHADSSCAEPSGKPKGTAGKQQSWNMEFVFKTHALANYSGVSLLG